MYCASCGSEVQEGLRYCNRCGANLAAESSSAPPRMFGVVLALAAAVAVVGVAGLVAIFFFAIELMGRGSVPAETIVFLIVFSLVVFGIDAMLIRQLSRALSAYLKTGGATQTEKPKLHKPKPVNELTEQKQGFIAAQSPHQTSPQESEQTTRVLQNEEPATRKLESNE